MQEPSTTIRKSQSIRAPSHLLSVALWAALVFGSLILLSQGKAFFIPLVIALIVVYLVHALSRGIQRIPVVGKFLPGPLAVVLSFVTIFFLGYGLFSLIADNARSVAAEAPRYQAILIELQQRTFDELKIEEPDSVTDMFRSIDLRSVFTTVATGLAALLGNITLVFLYSLFLLLEVRFLPTKLQALFPDQNRLSMVEDILSRIDKDVQTYLGVKTVVSLVTGLLSYIVMRLVGLDFAEFWALLIFIFNYIPTLGSIISTIFPTVLAIVQFQALGPVLIVGLGITAIQQLMGSILEPNIMGESLNLSPLVVVISLILWGHLWGIVGMFLCVPITVILVIILSNFEKTRWVSILLSKSGSLRIQAKLPGTSPEAG